ncbi:MAG: glycosyltransferase family 2 protein [Thermoanaerobaculia bacterium]
MPTFESVPHAPPVPATPRVSIIVTCYNLGSYLVEALTSARACDPTRVETIIVDDGSSQRRTIKVLEEVEKKGWRVIHQENQGVAAARNTGIAAARGEYILPLDADNRVRSDYPVVAMEVLDADRSIGVVYGDCEIFGKQRGPRHIPDFDLHRLHLGNYIDVCAAFRKQVWIDVGGFDRRLGPLGHDDWDFWLSVAGRGWRFHHIPRVMFDYRVRNGSMLSRAATPEMYESLIRHLSTKHRYFADHHAEIAASLNRAILEYRNNLREATRYALSLKRALTASEEKFLEAERYAKSLEDALADAETERSQLKECLAHQS